MVWLKIRRAPASVSSSPAKSATAKDPPVGTEVAQGKSKPVAAKLSGRRVGHEPSNGNERPSRLPSGKPVLSQLHELICSGAYGDGCQLPPERHLAEQLGVGRPALREAIRALNALGVLETRHGSGTFVKSSRPGNLIFDPLSLSQSNIGFLELLEVLKMLEPRAAWLAATRASEAHMREMEAARRELERPELAVQRIGELDLAFHCAVIRAAQNHLLLLTHQVLHPLLLKPTLIKAGPPRDFDHLADQHRAVADAIIRRLPEAAERTMLEHLDAWGRAYLSRDSG